VPVHARRPLHPVRSFIADETARLSSGQFMFLTGLTALAAPNNAVVSSPSGNAVEQGHAALTRKAYAEAARVF